MTEEKNITVRPYTETDQENIWTLYVESELGTLWPIKKERLFNVLLGNFDTNNKINFLVAEKDNKIVGFIVVKNKIIGDENRGVITLLLVGKNYRNIGIGTILMRTGEDCLRKQGATVVKLGGGAGTWLWSGIPENLDSLEFFKKMGFSIDEDLSVDMVQNIQRFTPPANVYERLASLNIVIVKATHKDSQNILDFEKSYFIDWYDYYKQDIDGGDFENILLAKHENELVGVTGIWTGYCNWDLLFENSVGGGKALGVSPDWQKRGIGLALKSYGTEMLRDKGIKYCWIGWTYEVDFYKKLGFEVWRRYYTGEKPLS